MALPAYLFAAFGVLAVFGTGNATQVNTITTAIDSALSSFNVLPADAVKLVNLIIGVEFIKMLAKHTPGSAIEVLLFRHRPADGGGAYFAAGKSHRHRHHRADLCHPEIPVRALLR